MIIRSAFDLVDFDVDQQAKALVASLCAQRTMGVWAVSGGGGSIHDLLDDALAAMYVNIGAPGESSAEALPHIHEAVLNTLHPDVDFGSCHSAKVDAVSSVAHAIACVVALGDERAVSEESQQAAAAEISMVKGAYYLRHGTYTGVYETPSFNRQIQLQLDDLAALRSGVDRTNMEQLRGRATDQGLVLGHDICRT